MSAKLCFVLIRGILREARHWGEFPELLQKQYPDALILTPDIPGNGSLSHLTSPNTIAGMTDALRSQIPEHIPLHLVGLSMGGMIAIDWMARYPEQISSAILINTSLSNFSPFYQRLRWQIYPRAISLIFTAKHKREPVILALTSNNRAHDRELIKDWQRWQHEHPVSGISAINQLLASSIFTLHTIPDPPILIISSTADRLVDYRCSIKLQQNWHKDYQQHDVAGHDLPLDEPHWLLAVIGQWLGQH